MEWIGLLSVNKPSGPTSRQVVDRVKRLVRPAKVGHAGTLDPLASGVLVVCVGQATRLIQYVQNQPKRYRAAFRLGQTSETDDTEGELVAVLSAVPPSAAALKFTVQQFVGRIMQRPPAHSAIKIGGKRAYRLARRGEDVKLEPRPVEIHRIDVCRYEYPMLELEVECGSGTYIRSLGRDLGHALGTGAVMTFLERTAIGPFPIASALKADQLNAESIEQHLQPALWAVAGLPRVTLSVAQLFEVRHGRPILRSWLPEAMRTTNSEGEIAALDTAGLLAAILYEKCPDELWPKINLAPVN
ncbi:MAG: tRNA pseudouridine(55) synthase TruB [Pirellulales bacterium]|nr:tRNA pseudouridine(55) synthase TruB [Pirellulales bacterium]